MSVDYAIQSLPVSNSPNPPPMPSYALLSFPESEPASLAASEVLRTHAPSPPQETQHSAQQQEEEEAMPIEDDVVMAASVMAKGSVDYSLVMEHEKTRGVSPPEPSSFLPTNAPPPQPSGCVRSTVLTTDKPTRTTNTTTTAPHRSTHPRPSHPLNAKERARGVEQPAKNVTTKPAIKLAKSKPFNIQIIPKPTQDNRPPLAQLQV
jgi:hypothetical protein